MYKLVRVSKAEDDAVSELILQAIKKCRVSGEDRRGILLMLSSFLRDTRKWGAGLANPLSPICLLVCPGMQGELSSR